MPSLMQHIVQEYVRRFSRLDISPETPKRQFGTILMKQQLRLLNTFKCSLEPVRKSKNSQSGASPEGFDQKATLNFQTIHQSGSF